MSPLEPSKAKALLRQGYRVPIYRELPADLETPVSLYLKLRQGGPSFLLESVERAERIGRYSFLGVQPTACLVSRGEEAQIIGQGWIRTEHLDNRDPLDVVKRCMSCRPVVSVPELPRFNGGAVGYVGYEVVRFFEPRLQNCIPAARSSFDLPDTVFLLTDTLVIFDHARQQILIVAHAADSENTGSATAAYEDAVERIEALIAQISQPLPPQRPPLQTSPGELTANITQAQFEDAVRRAKAYIATGDIFQVVISQRLQRWTPADPFSIYRALRRVNPSPYMFYLDLPGGLHLIGSSPEVLVRLENGIAEIRPLAGTRPRGHSQAEDEALACELLADPKERAEHVMLVDLARNDLGRVCRYGTVRVPTMMTIERYSHVMHIVSEVIGELDPRHDAFDLLRATFPAGTVSGAPKVRAMEIIAELEALRRGPYAGAVGYFDYSGNMDTCIAIRTIVMDNQMAYLQAGAGIVADSDPTREYEETLYKARALAEAVEMAERDGQLGTKEKER